MSRLVSGNPDVREKHQKMVKNTYPLAFFQEICYNKKSAYLKSNVLVDSFI